VSRAADWKQAIGPGLLYAGAAVGVSHIVQSTRAGALYGFALLGFVVLVNVLKYPFFEFGARYTAATGDSLLAGYRKLGKWVLPAFVILTLVTMFPILAAISSVFTGIVLQILAPELAPMSIHGMALAGCVLLLMLGRYKILDRSMRLIMLLLTVTTLVAALAALSQLPLLEKAASGSFSWDIPGLLFLIAFAGWMPTPVDSSVWQSLWTLEKRKTVGVLSWKAIKFDFDIGYWLSMVLALLFVFLGGVVLFATGAKVPAQGAAFTAAFLKIYVQLLGPWAYGVVAISIFATIFSTLLTVIDGYPRVLQESWRLLSKSEEPQNKHYWISMIVFVGGSLLLLTFYADSMLTLVDLATSLSFLTAPVLGWWNFRLIYRSDFPKENLPNNRMLWLARMGLVFLTVFCAFYLADKLGWLA